MIWIIGSRVHSHPFPACSEIYLLVMKNNYIIVKESDVLFLHQPRISPQAIPEVIDDLIEKMIEKNGEVILPDNSLVDHYDRRVQTTEHE